MAKIEVYLSLPCWLSQLNFRPHATVIWNLVKPLVLILSRDGSSFNMWIDAFKGWASLYYVLQLMISRGGPSLLCEFMLSRSGPSFTMSIDAFKGWASFIIRFSWWFQGVCPLLKLYSLMPAIGGPPPMKYKLIVLSGGPPIYVLLVDIKGWAPLSWWNAKRFDRWARSQIAI